jgi:Cdc6-like AAA superfamily ATPase
LINKVIIFLFLWRCHCNHHRVSPFFAATNLYWKKLHEPDKYKDVIIDSMKFLVKEKRVVIYGFVIMPNHIHLLWHLRAGETREHVQLDNRFVGRLNTKPTPIPMACFFLGDTTNSGKKN